MMASTITIVPVPVPYHNVGGKATPLQRRPKAILGSLRRTIVVKSCKGYPAKQVAFLFRIILLDYSIVARSNGFESCSIEAYAWNKIYSVESTTYKPFFHPKVVQSNACVVVHKIWELCNIAKGPRVLERLGRLQMPIPPFLLRYKEMPCRMTSLVLQHVVRPHSLLWQLQQELGQPWPPSAYFLRQNDKAFLEHATTPRRAG
jgi:hypothetical protein